jgi:Regulator of chromosome condensation (RCC1) repeat
MRKFIIVLSVLLGFAACDDDSTTEGVENAKCYPNGTCNEYLDCIQDVCVRKTEVCDNHTDDDGNGLEDCDDTACATELSCESVEICNNQTDDDGDNLVDCDDTDCSTKLICADTEICNNNEDDDGDTLIDCADDDCSESYVCNNHEPVITSTPSATSIEGVEFIYTIDCSDEDGDTVVVVKATSDTCDGTVTTVDGTTMYTFTPDWGSIDGTCVVSLECSDGTMVGSQEQMVTTVGDWGKIKVGGKLSCYLDEQGYVSCWGDDNAGTLVIPSATRFADFEVGGDGFVDSYAFICGINLDRTAQCWGNNSYEQLNIPNIKFKSLGLGETTGCGITMDSTVVCWGDDSRTDATPTLSTFNNISCSIYHCCGIKVDNSVECWKQLGNDYGAHLAPTGEFKHISTAWTHTCGIKITGETLCWGCTGTPTADRGQCTVPDYEFKKVETGDTYSIGLTADGTLVFWGENYENRYLPLPTGKFKELVSGPGHICGIRENDELHCWGWNDHGQCDDATRIEN